jgi:hypothetical protein
LRQREEQLAAAEEGVADVAVVVEVVKVYARAESGVLRVSRSVGRW